MGKVAELRAEVAELRAELAALRDGTGELHVARIVLDDGHHGRLELNSGFNDDPELCTTIRPGGLWVGHGKDGSWVSLSASLLEASVFVAADAGDGPHVSMAAVNERARDGGRSYVAVNGDELPVPAATSS